MRALPARIRWLPVPLAVAATLAGWVILGDALGQHTDGHVHSYEAGGLSLSVNRMVWMSNDMSGQGPVAHLSQGFQMAQSMMPGMQTVDNDRLRLEVTLRNSTSDAQQYTMSDFHVVAPSGQTWGIADDGGNTSQKQATLGPGFSATVDLYFDIPTTQSKNLSIVWSRDGSTVEIPVTSAKPSPHTH
jgi:hypothetical protein